MEIVIGCCLCSEEHKTEIELPEGWASQGVDDSDGFCPKHSPIDAFRTSQCPGCVGGWGDCPMWKAFSSSSGRTIGAGDYELLEKGICPRRVNGTFGVSDGRIEDLDLSDRAPPESGAAFAKAIREYCLKYPVR